MLAIPPLGGENFASKLAPTESKSKKPAIAGFFVRGNQPRPWVALRTALGIWITTLSE